MIGDRDRLVNIQRWTAKSAGLIELHYPNQEWVDMNWINVMSDAALALPPFERALPANQQDTE